MDIDYELHLTDLISTEILQRVQDVFSNTTGIAALTTDANGIAATEGTNFTDFCMKCTRSTEVGYNRCMECDRKGAKLALEQGEPAVYICHAGLLEFSAPIVADGKLIGCFLGGQVLKEAIDSDQIRKTAAEIGVDPEEYVKAAEKVNIVEQDTVDKAVKFLRMTADILSEMAHNKYLVYKANMELEKSGNMKSDFLANMSHEIRTPLNAIVGFSDVIGSTYDELSEEERADFVRLISINSEHLVRLIDDILDLSKIESNTIKFTFSNCSLNSLMMDIEKEQAMKPISEIEIKSLLPDEDVYINTDITRLKQVICNFINNARKFTQKGYIHFGYTLDNRNADSVQIFVEDTGSGIPQECLNEIFDRFYKVDTFKQGTGLGLSICKTIVEHLQGDISVKSEIGKGSCFTVTLPFDRKTED